LAIGLVELSSQNRAEGPEPDGHSYRPECVVKIVNHVSYISDAEKVASVRPVHRAFMSKLGEQGRLVAAGPLRDGSGAIFIYEADNLEDAEAIFAQDPYTLAGVVAGHTMQAWEIVNVYPDLFRPTGR
jgi:uncharacterized protein YciI